MYLPKHFTADAADTRELLTGIRAADLITATADGPYATFLPLLYVPGPDGEFGSLHGHVARGNEHHRLATIGESLVIVHGLDGYITPSWYPSKREHGKVVPTWNYLLAHVYGELVIHDDVDWLETVVRGLTDRQEGGRDAPWSVDDAPREYTEGMLRGTVGVELAISRVEAKAKLGQNRSAADLDGVQAGLWAAGDGALAELTERHRPGH